MRRLILPLLFAPLVAVAQPAPRYGLSPPDAGDRPGEEQPLPLPPFPKEENLVKVTVDALGSFDYFVDFESVSVGADGVVHYTIVARSTGGATNIAFEGIRCKDRYRRLYAFGRPDQTWSRARDSRWVSISGLPVNTAQAALHDKYFCPFRTIVRDTEEARRVLKLGGNSRADLPR